MLKTILASPIPGLGEKYNDNPAYKAKPDMGVLFQNIVLDIYKWGETHKHEIINIVNFNTPKGFELVVVYKEEWKPRAEAIE